MKGDPGFKDIYYRDKRITPDGFPAKIAAIPVAVEHNSDGSVTVCKEIADLLFNDRRVPEEYRKHFDTSPLILKITGDALDEKA